MTQNTSDFSKSDDEDEFKSAELDPLAESPTDSKNDDDVLIESTEDQ